MLDRHAIECKEQRIDPQIVHDVKSILTSEHRDYVISNNGDQVPVSDFVVGKYILLYFSAHRCLTSHESMSNLVETYKQIKATNGAFEVIFISSDDDETDFREYFTKMPWLALPFGDDRKKYLDSIFRVISIPMVVYLSPNGNTITSDEAWESIMTHGSEVYPSSTKACKLEETEANYEEKVEGWPEKVKHELHEHEISLNKRKTYTCDGCNEAGNKWSYICKKCNFNLHPQCALSENEFECVFDLQELNSRSRDYGISADVEKASVLGLEGKTIGLYFSASSDMFSSPFTQKLTEVYKKLKEKGEDFEVIMLPIEVEDDEESFGQNFMEIPWFSLHIEDKLCAKLALHFEIDDVPTLVIIGPDGKTLHSDAVEIIEEHGDMAYPFTPEKFFELERAKWEARTMESVLVSGDLDFVIGKDGIKVPISNLIGKHILLFCSARGSAACCGFMSEVVKTYREIKAKEEAFEIIFISYDDNYQEFEKYFAEMPWLALPFRDDRKDNLDGLFNFTGHHTIVALGPTGKTITTEAGALVANHGAEAYPFTEARLKEIEAKYERMAKGWPEKVKHELHKHELSLSRRNAYICDECDEIVRIWSFFCEECNFGLHPKCALKEKESKVDDEKERAKEGWVCDVDVCFKTFCSYLTRVCFKA